MRKWQILTSIFCMLVVCDQAKAGDKEDVAATMDAIKAAWTAGDVDACLKHIAAEEVDVYLGNGSLLPQMDWEGARAAFAAGLKVKIQSIAYQSQSLWRSCDPDGIHDPPNYPPRWNPYKRDGAENCRLR